MAISDCCHQQCPQRATIYTYLEFKGLKVVQGTDEFKKIAFHLELKPEFSKSTLAQKEQYTINEVRPLAKGLELNIVHTVSSPFRPPLGKLCIKTPVVSH